jgi:hypothetical protein
VIAQAAAGTFARWFGDRVQLADIFSIGGMAVVLAAAVALSCSEPAGNESAAVARWCGVGYGALGVVAVADSAASICGLVNAFLFAIDDGRSRVWAERFALAAAALAAGAIAVAAAGLIRRFRMQGPGDLEVSPFRATTARARARGRSACVDVQQHDAPRERAPDRLAAGRGCRGDRRVHGAHRGGLGRRDGLRQRSHRGAGTVRLDGRGIALAAALVMAVSRRDASAHAPKEAFDATVALLSVASLAVSGYSIWIVLFGSRHGRFSFLAQASAAARVSLIGTSVTAVLIAAAALDLIARGRRSAPGGDT